jgi:hypothetical protein
LLTRIDVLSENAFYLPILGITPKDSLLIRKITGLNPPDINLFMGDYARDGGYYGGRRVGNRNVVVTMDLNPNPANGETVSGLREMLYKAFVDPQVDGDYIKMLLHDDDGRKRYLLGYVEKFETDIFDVETLAQISIICPDPYLRDDEETVYSNATGWTTVNFPYAGTAETGFEVWIYINTSTVSTPMIQLKNNNKTMVLNGPFYAGEIIKINTTRGARSIMKTPVGAVSDVSALSSLTADSPWLELHSQANEMKVFGSAESDSVATIRQIKFVQSYWGI